jgi:DNA circularisation protein N-terminus
MSIFASDLEHQWKSLPFPAASFRLRLRQDLAEHKYSEKDGAEMEPTGRAPLEFQARIPFLNSINTAANETWPAGRLYPGHLQAFIALAADRSKGVLQHPFLGNITCVLHEMDVEWTATTQDGTWANVTWIETFDATNDTAAILLQVSPISQAIGSAQDLDDLITTIQPPLPQTPTFTPNFADTMRSIQGLFDTATFLSMKVSGTIAQVNYRCQAILDAINRVQASTNTNGLPTTPNNTASVNSVMNGPARLAIDRLRVACFNLKKLIASSGKPIGLYVTSAPSTLPMIAIDIAQVSVGNVIPNMTDLFTLNGPSIVAQCVIPMGTTVRYYLPAQVRQPKTMTPPSQAPAF